MTNLHTVNGAGFEYENALLFSQMLNSPIADNIRLSKMTAKNIEFRNQPSYTTTAAYLFKSVSSFLDHEDNRHIREKFTNSSSIVFQNDACGAEGDKADFILKHNTSGETVGISCKHNSLDTSSFRLDNRSTICRLTGESYDPSVYSELWKPVVDVAHNDVRWREFEGRVALARGLRDLDLDILKRNLSSDRYNTIRQFSNLVYGATPHTYFYQISARKTGVSIKPDKVITEIMDLQVRNPGRAGVMSHSIIAQVVTRNGIEEIVVRYKNGDTYMTYGGNIKSVKPAISSKTVKPFV